VTNASSCLVFLGYTAVWRYARAASGRPCHRWSSRCATWTAFSCLLRATMLLNSPPFLSRWYQSRSTGTGCPHSSAHWQRIVLAPSVRATTGSGSDLPAESCSNCPRPRAVPETTSWPIASTPAVREVKPPGGCSTSQTSGGTRWVARSTVGLSLPCPRRAFCCVTCMASVRSSPASLLTFRVNENRFLRIT
jgi:hypothetical protein